MDFNRKPLIMSFVVIGSVAFIQGLSIMLTGGSPESAACLGGSAATSAFGALIIAKRFQMRVSMEMGLAIGAFLVQVTLGGALLLVTDDFNTRLRSHALSVAIWKPLPAVFGFPILPAAAFIFWTLVVDVGSLTAVHHYFGDPNELRVHITSVIYAIGWIAVANMNSGRLRSIFDAQEALAAEKVLMDSIITMMCDGIVWLSESGRTIVRTDQRFSMIMGRDVTGEPVERALAAEELERFQLNLSEAKTAPALLPTTLLTEGGAKVPVEMFIVGNREIRSTEGKAGMMPGYLIGLRTTSREGMETFQDASLNDEQQRLLQDTPAPQEAQEDELQSAAALSSVPETTATGRIFSHVDIDRWLERSPEERTDELRIRLEKVVSLGQQEQWLVGSKDLKIDAGHILGAGSFGVVVGGWFHGSPVAVKTTKHASDVAGIEHLVTIANEIRILRHVRHPNIVLFHGACIESVNGEIMLVLERVQGPDLYNYVTSHSSDAEVCNRYRLLMDVACALRYLHAQKTQIVHGDLKGSNVLVEEAMPRAKLVDFGLSRLLTKGVRSLGGTLNWMAPEIICRRSRPKASADAFSFGRVTYMVITCRKPLEGVRRRVIVDMAKSAITHTLLWDEGRPLHQECKGLCSRLSNPLPDQRPSMAEVHQEISAWTLPDSQGIIEAEAAAEDPAHGASGTGLFREVLSAALFRHRQEAQAHAPVGAGTTANRLLSPSGTGQETGTTAATCNDQNQAPAASAAPGTAASPAADLALPAFRPTEEAVKQLMMVDIAMQWNFPAAPGACCLFHASAAELDRVRLTLARQPCKSVFRPHDQHQCPSCGVMDMQSPEKCLFCSGHVQRSLGSIQEEEELSQDGGETRCSL